MYGHGGNTSSRVFSTRPVRPRLGSVPEQLNSLVDGSGHPMRGFRIIGADTLNDVSEVVKMLSSSTAVASRAEHLLDALDYFVMIQEVAASGRPYGLSLWPSIEARIIFQHPVDRFFDHLRDILARAGGELMYERFFLCCKMWFHSHNLRIAWFRALCEPYVQPGD